MYSIGNLKTQSFVPHHSYGKWFVQGGWEGKQEEDFINIEIYNFNVAGFFGIDPWTVLIRANGRSPLLIYITSTDTGQLRYGGVGKPHLSLLVVKFIITDRRDFPV